MMLMILIPVVKTTQANHQMMTSRSLCQGVVWNLTQAQMMSPMIVERRGSPADTDSLVFEEDMDEYPDEYS